MAKKTKVPAQISVATIGLVGVIAAAVIGLCGTIIVAYFGYLGIRTQIEEPIDATSTAEARLTALANIFSPTPLQTPTVSNNFLVHQITLPQKWHPIQTGNHF